jgi:hypothetical protein
MENMESSMADETQKWRNLKATKRQRNETTWDEMARGCTKRSIYNIAETWQHNPDFPAGHLQNVWVDLLS